VEEIMVEAQDGGAGVAGYGVPLRLHNILLALAGRLDDSALSGARELVARSHLDDAVELVVGTLIAGSIPVQPVEQRELAVVLEMSRSDAALADQLVVRENLSAPGHRFTRENEPERGVAEALQRSLRVLPDVRTVHSVWRTTPAGAVPGSLPQRVLLVDIGPEGHPPAIAYRLDVALRRAGIRAVVEVTGPTTELTNYHDEALSSAEPVWLAASGLVAAASQPAQRPRRSGAAHALSPVRDEQRQEPRNGAHSLSATGSGPAPQTPPQPPQPPPQAPASSSPQPTAPSVQGRSEVQKPDNGRRDGKRDRDRVISTAEMSAEEVTQLRAALAAGPEKGKSIAAARLSSGEVVEIPELDLNDPQLSERDRKLLLELHAELAERERSDAAKVNGANGAKRWDGFSSS
jgi:hypothetical protein